MLWGFCDISHRILDPNLGRLSQIRRRTVLARTVPEKAAEIVLSVDSKMKNRLQPKRDARPIEPILFNLFILLV